MHRAAGRSRLRPGWPGLPELLLGGLGLAILPVIMLEEFADRLFESRAQRNRRASEKAAKARRIKGIRAAWGATDDAQIFDGDWTRSAGQLLLRWFAVCPSHERLFVLQPDRITLIGPSKRPIYPDQARKLRVIGEFSGREARLEAPNIDNDPAYLRLRFADGSWVILRVLDVAAARPFMTAVRAA